MTIPEAASSVLQSSAGSSGDVPADMGEPVRIALAEQMVRLSGLSPVMPLIPMGTLKSPTGLRPGEKLYEELLIDAESHPTAHPLTHRAMERSLPPHELWPQLMPCRQRLRRRCGCSAHGIGGARAGVAKDKARCGSCLVVMRAGCSATALPSACMGGGLCPWIQPPTPAQFTNLCAEAAAISRSWGWHAGDISLQSVMTHAVDVLGRRPWHPQTEMAA